MFRKLFCAFSFYVLSTMMAIAGPTPQSVLAELPHVGFPAPHRIASGSVQASDVASLKKAGVRVVIDLRGADETPAFDEQAAVRTAGIIYHNLPIRGADDLTPENVKRFDQLLTKAGNRLTLVHCASSNRVGAMITLRAAIIQGQSAAAALAEGRRWGLKSMEPVVRERLQAWSRNDAKPPQGH